MLRCGLWGKAADYGTKDNRALEMSHGFYFNDLSQGLVTDTL